MGTIIEVIFSFLIDAIIFIIEVVIWGYVLFYIGVTVLKIITFSNYPTGMQLEKHVNVISGAGLNAIYIFWACISTYNYNENIYFLVTGLVVAIFQSLLITTKYYSQDRNQYGL